MVRGERVALEGYELCATIGYASAAATAVVVHNNSTHYLVFVVDESELGEKVMQYEGRFVISFRYDHLPEDTMVNLYKSALDYATGMAVGFLSE